MTLSSFVLCLLTGVTLTACHAGEGALRISTADRPACLNAPSEEANDAARFLAGLPGRPGSAWKRLESDPAWEEHARQIDRLWSLYQNQRRAGMEKFRQTELVGTPLDGAAIWYPFSGGDALTMLTFFPGHRSYSMAALEPPGRVPGVEDFEDGRMAEELPALAGTLGSLLRKSFFVTREMDRQLRGQAADGVTQPILILLARLGYRILSHTYVHVEDDGHLARRILEPRRTAFGLNRGVIFEIQRDGGPVALLHYTSLNLDDAHMKLNAGYAAYVGSLGRPVTMLKATSYMPHSKAFSMVRALILERSGAIVQDDSGIPWYLLAKPEWRVQLYGEYTRPYGKDFAFRTQPDLREAYDAQHAAVRPLSFRMGYGAGRQLSNLQVARRR